MESVRFEPPTEKVNVHRIGYYLSLVATGMSLLAPIIYLAWFGATVEKRVSLIEQHEIEFESRMADLKSSLDRVSDHFDNIENINQNETHKEIAQLSTRIEKIYQILLENRVNQNSE
jgi:hypothetical protein